MADDLATLFSGLKLDDIRVDSLGNIRIANRDLGKRIADRKGAFDADTLADSLNTGTCNNTACFAPGLEQIRTNPAVAARGR